MNASTSASAQAHPHAVPHAGAPAPGPTLRHADSATARRERGPGSAAPADDEARTACAASAEAAEAAAGAEDAPDAEAAPGGCRRAATRAPRIDLQQRRSGAELAEPPGDPLAATHAHDADSKADAVEAVAVAIDTAALRWMQGLVPGAAAHALPSGNAALPSASNAALLPASDACALPACAGAAKGHRDDPLGTTTPVASGAAMPALSATPADGPAHDDAPADAPNAAELPGARDPNTAASPLSSTTPPERSSDGTAAPQDGTPIAAPAGLGAAFATALAAPREAALRLGIAIPTPLDAPGFAHSLGMHLKVLARDGVQRAELHLSPPEMGPVSVHIRTDGTQAQVHFGADLAATRHVLEAAMPMLAAALREGGFTLAGGGVSQHAQGRGDDAGSRRDPPADNRRSLDDAGADALEGSARVARHRVAPGGVDLYV